MNHPYYNYLECLEQERSEAEAQEEHDNEGLRAFGSYDARIGRYPQSADASYLEAYCAVIREIANPLSLEVVQPGKVTWSDSWSNIFEQCPESHRPADLDELI